MPVGRYGYSSNRVWGREDSFEETTGKPDAKGNDANNNSNENCCTQECRGSLFQTVNKYSKVDL